MSSNSGEPQGTGADGSSSDQTNLLLAVVALVVSIVALITAVLQALQQYFSSATGYSSCSRTVMGEWAQFTRRRIRWDQFRLQVEFEVPTIFVAPPTNTKGPLGSNDEKKIVYMDGSSKSYGDTYTWNQVQYDQKAYEGGGDTHQSVHTADNELAAWVKLLMAIQRMEKESRDWQDNNFYSYKTPERSKTSHTLTVAMQRKRRTWDSMPNSLKKPYATTTISHMVEIAAMLGIYWKQFDRDDDKYRAQGNGFTIEGSYVDGLGLAFTFEKAGPTWFHENRVVPNDQVKELCFGFCPTIFRAQGDKSHMYADEPKDKGTLQLGSLAEIAETLVVFGCNTNTVNYFRQDPNRARHTHLFPVPFEILGMIGVVLQIEDTAFSMLPNPTVFYWDRRSFSLRRLVIHYSSALEEGRLGDKMLKTNARITAIRQAAARIESQFLNQGAAAKNDTSAVPPRKSTGEKPVLPKTMAVLRSAIKECDQYLMEADVLPLVLHVVRAHLQEILKVLNWSSATADGNTDEDPGNVAPNTLEKEGGAIRDDDDTNAGPLTLEKLDAATSIARHGLFVNLYVSWVRKRVIQTVHDELQVEQEQAQHSTLVATTPDALPKMPSSNKTTTDGEETSGAPSSQEQLINDIWCTLMFRMLCWFLMHDFHKKDVQISKSELFESRLPVYIM